MLAIMAIPTISSISEDALYSVPREYKEASYALGATKFETIVRVIVPSAMSGISTAVILGMARAIGETMVVLMVAGGAAALPESIFDAVRPMPASIAAEMGEAPFRSLHYHCPFCYRRGAVFHDIGFQPGGRPHFSPLQGNRFRDIVEMSKAKQNWARSGRNMKKGCGPIVAASRISIPSH